MMTRSQNNWSDITPVFGCEHSYATEGFDS